MANVWGTSWGNAWGPSWGQLIVTQEGIFVWLGTTWERRLIQAWDGHEWKIYNVKRWDGNSWISVQNATN